jgi:hypothetical protein
VRAGLLIAWLQPDVCGFRYVLAHGWHEATYILIQLVALGPSLYHLEA